MPETNHTAPAAYVHPDDPAGWLKPDDTLMAGGYDFAWCFVWFKDIPGKPGYKVGFEGSVWSCAKQGRRTTNGMLDRWHRLNPKPNTRGYLQVRLGRRDDGRRDRRGVHTLVLEAFVGPCPPGLVCRHFPDREPTNNRLENLSWGSRKQNQADRLVHGTDSRGEKNGKTKLTEADVIEVLAMRAEGKRTADIARWFGVNRNTIRLILIGWNWRHVTGLSPTTRT